MTTLATAEMAAYCFDVVLATLNKQPSPPCPTSIPDTPSPIFVTWKTLPQDRLRGCIGNFSPAPLRRQLEEYAKISAFHDDRFRPVTQQEVPKLACTVSLLHSFEPCRAWDDWKIGIHGIRIRYKNYGATYLPSVAAEEGWDHRETMQSLLQKGGYYGEVNEQVLRDVAVTRYQVSLFTLNYDEYAKMRR